jgi:hypothetical protein
MPVALALIDDDALPPPLRAVIAGVARRTGTDASLGLVALALVVTCVALLCGGRCGDEPYGVESRPS